MLVLKRGMRLSIQPVTRADNGPRSIGSREKRRRIDAGSARLHHTGGAHRVVCWTAHHFFRRRSRLMTRLELIATAAFGLEAVVARELADLGYTQQQVEDGRVTFIGGELAICRSNLWLRTADRVLVKVGQFPARDFGQLFDSTTALPWDYWLPVDAKFPVNAKSVRSLLHNVPSIQSVVKKAIVENLKRKYTRHWFQESGVEYPIEVSVPARHRHYHHRYQRPRIAQAGTVRLWEPLRCGKRLPPRAGAAQLLESRSAILGPVLRFGNDTD